MVEGAYSLDDGHQLWLTNRTQSAWTRLSASSGALDGIYTEFTYETQSMTAYSILTGAKLWGPIVEKGSDDSWGSYSTTTIMAYGAVYTSDLDGYVYALNETTGAIMWTWNTGSAGYETPYNVWPLWFINSIADGKVYVLGGHQYSPPLFHGARLYCLNASTGAEIWDVLDFSDSNNPSTALADGTLIVPNAYDNQIYAIAPGQSATTLAATPETSTLNTQVLIKGTVTDQSPGQTSLGIPAAGTPAISDQYMTQWMEYLYEQQPMPKNATGVQVTLTALDSNNNTQTIGTATSDITGHYTFAWTPTISGVYQITATFGGSNSYYSSTAETSIAVSEAAATIAPTATPTNTLEAAMNTQLYIIAAGMIAVVVIVLAAAFAIFKKVAK
jgi:outer membrane protein assembly factor BamB